MGERASLVPWLVLSAKPEARVHWVHRVGDDRQEVTAQRVEIDLVRKLAAERVEHLTGVVVRAIETAIDGGLDASPERLEECEARER